ncbi:HAUS augmin-like complex subunit 2 isoform X1 [Myotis yumanensis]|uniref:HAUS augmin-like complex subunit 2 isoform X1 n=1 Tax=Myotis yumanensis TaxID=159337 RepID=UPI0038CFABEC
MAAADPGDPAPAPNPAGLLLGHLVASGTVAQEILDISKKSTPCFVNFSRLQQITNIQAEINQKNLEIELLKLEKDTADIVHASFLAQKCQTLQSMNNHLEAVLKEKRSLRQRLLKPMCQENLPIEAVYHRYMVHLLELAVTFIERLETHLETIRNIPHLDANLKRMDCQTPVILANLNAPQLRYLLELQLLPVRAQPACSCFCTSYESLCSFHFPSLVIRVLSS